MRFAVWHEKDGRRGLAVEHGDRLNGLFADAASVIPAILKPSFASGADLVAVGRGPRGGKLYRSRFCTPVASAITPRKNRVHWPQLQSALRRGGIQVANLPNECSHDFTSSLIGHG